MLYVHVHKSVYCTKIFNHILSYDHIVRQLLFTGPPVIIVHPGNKVINASMSTTLNCKGTGGGSIVYKWEYKSIDEGQWKSIDDSNTEKLVIRNLQQSEKYRCLVSNQAGRTVSNTSTVILMSKLFTQIGIVCIDMFTYTA